MDFFEKMDNSWVYKMHKNNWTIHSFETVNHPKTWNLEAHVLQHSWFAGFLDLMRSFLRRAPSQKISVRNGFSRCFSYRISTNSPTAMLFRVKKSMSGRGYAKGSYRGRLYASKQWNCAATLEIVCPAHTRRAGYTEVTLKLAISRHFHAIHGGQPPSVLRIQGAEMSSSQIGLRT